MESYDAIFSSISELVMHHSPSGTEHEVDELLRTRFQSLGLKPYSDRSGNLICKIPGRGGGAVAITAHKDEIGAIVAAIEEDGRIKVRRLGGSYPWVYGEGVVDLLGDHGCVPGVLSFGSRHVSHASPQHAHLETAPVKWADVWVETKLTASELATAGVRIGTPLVIGKHRKAPLRLKNHIASYTLDNKASLAVILELAQRLKSPGPDVYLLASAKEEIGAIGAMYFSRRQELDALIALEVAPMAPEYSIKDSLAPVLLAEDSFGLYDGWLNEKIRRASASREIPLQMAVVSGFGSDGSVTMRAGNVPKAACLGFATQNTHGYEIAHLGAIENCVRILEALCQESFV